MKNKRFLTLVLCLALAALALGALAACNDGGEELPPEPTAVVTLDSSVLTVDLYDGVQLSAETENTEEAVVWATSDASVVTVENGYVFGVREGTATVTASAGGASATCTVTVASSGAVPVLEGVPEALTVLVGSPVKVQPRALYKGNEISVTFGYSSENAQTATFENGTLTGVAAGEAEVIVRAQYYDYILEQSIQVTVVSAE